MAMDIEAEIRELKRRVGELEGSFGFLTRQGRDMHKELLTFRASMEQFRAKTEQWQKRAEQRFDTVERDLREVRTDVRGLREDMPGIVAGAMREVLGRPRAKARKSVMLERSLHACSVSLSLNRSYRRGDSG